MKRGLVTVAATIVLVIAAVLWVISANAGVTEPADEPVACDATEYEGCPERWAYLWAEDD